MAPMEVTVVHHAAVLMAALWAAAAAGWAHPLLFVLAVVYLHAVNKRYLMRLRKRILYEERKNANQRKLLSESESVRWLNIAVEKMWPVCMERIASEQFLLPIIPWFLEKFKPWTVNKAEFQRLYLGRAPPMFTYIRVNRETTDDDHLVLEVGMSFLAADDMNAVMAVQLRKSLALGITANMHVTGMHVEGKIRVGVKFLRSWPFIGRVRLCFVEPPYFQMTVKPIFGHGLDVTELPGISGWLDKLLDTAFGETLVEPNMLVADVEKMVDAPQERWFSIDEKPPVAYAKVEILEGADMKPSDLNGLADPYVNGRLGSYRFQTKIHKKTLSPKWLEEFKVPISSWEADNLLMLEVRDKDPIFDDMLGNCSININRLRGGQRHDLWVPLENIKMGRIHVAVTVVEAEQDEDYKRRDVEPSEKSNLTVSDVKTQWANLQTDDSTGSDAVEEKIADEFEPVKIEGLDKTSVWVHRPGSSVSQKWEPRKGRARQPVSNILVESMGPKHANESSPSTEISCDDKPAHPKLDKIKRGFGRLSAVFHRSPRKESPVHGVDELNPPATPGVNLRSMGDRRISVKFVVDDDAVADDIAIADDRPGVAERSSPEEQRFSGDLKNRAKEKAKEAGKLVHSFRRRSRAEHDGGWRSDVDTKDAPGGRVGRGSSDGAAA